MENENSPSQIETEKLSNKSETTEEETEDVPLTEEADELVYTENILTDGVEDEYSRADGIINGSDSTFILDYLNNELEVPVILDGSNDTGGFRDYSGCYNDENGNIIFSYAVRTNTGTRIKTASFSTTVNDQELLISCYEHLGIDSSTNIKELIENFDNETKIICEKDYTIFLSYKSYSHTTELKFSAPNDDYDACYH